MSKSSSYILFILAWTFTVWDRYVSCFSSFFLSCCLPQELARLGAINSIIIRVLLFLARASVYVESYAKHFRPMSFLCFCLSMVYVELSICCWCSEFIFAVLHVEHLSFYWLLYLLQWFGDPPPKCEGQALTFRFYCCCIVLFYVIQLLI